MAITGSVIDVRSSLQDAPATSSPRILFPTDLSAHAMAAWPYAAGLAREGGAELHLLHVVAPPPIGANSDGAVLWPSVLVKELLAEAQAVVTAAAARTRALGVLTQAHTTFGEAASEIVAYAATQRIGLIVMATTGRTGAAHLLLGSVAEQVVRHATCPVLTVRHDRAAAPPPLLSHALPRLRRILVPLDGSRLAEAVLPHIVQLSKRHGAELRLLRVAHAHALRDADLATAQLRVVQEAEAYLAGVAHRLAVKGVSASPAVRYGGTLEEILDDLWVNRPDLVAMSTHGRTWLTHLLLGSVAEQVLRASPVPVLLFPARALVAVDAVRAARSAAA
jgi:nucleotide-binding universal stress UspA family protein